MSDITFNCPHCQQHIEAPDEMVGMTAQCPTCQKNLQVPKKIIVLKVAAPPVIQAPLPPPSSPASTGRDKGLIALACTNCGSPRVTEFKPGSYICANCETTFKWVDPSKQTVEVKGNISVSTEIRCELCAVTGKFEEATGKCTICGRCACWMHGSASSYDLFTLDRIFYPNFRLHAGSIYDSLKDELNNTILGCYRCYSCENSAILNSLLKRGLKCKVCNAPVITADELLQSNGAFCDACDTLHILDKSPQKYPFHRDCTIGVKQIGALYGMRVCLACARDFTEVKSRFKTCIPPRWKHRVFEKCDIEITDGLDRFIRYRQL